MHAIMENVIKCPAISPAPFLLTGLLICQSRVAGTRPRSTFELSLKISFTCSWLIDLFYTPQTTDCVHQLTISSLATWPACCITKLLLTWASLSSLFFFLLIGDAKK